MSFCTGCGSSISNENKFCANCGKALGVLPIESPPTVSSVKYSGFWRRFAALSVEVSCYNMLYGIVIYAANIDVLTLNFGVTFWIISLLVGFFYYTLMTHKYGGTLGKLFVGLRIRKKDGANDISYLRSVVRYLSYFISMIVLGIGFFIQPFTKNKQALHDLIADTVVIDIKKRPSIQIWLINLLYVLTTIFVQFVAVLNLE